MCFTINAIPTCRYPAKPVGSAKKMVDFYCAPKSSSEAQHFSKLIAKGAAPSQLSLKKPNQKFEVNIPEYCVA
uniref:Vitellogenin n=3 Tax=Bemisia tabaci TaxID=7038 RepID=A0A7G3PII7_BEMTA|nr:vitellogenin [Bemisia tabaci]